MKGVEAQTLTNVQVDLENNLEIIPVRSLSCFTENIFSWKAVLTCLYVNPLLWERLEMKNTPNYILHGFDRSKPCAYV